MNPIERMKSWIWPKRERETEVPPLPADHKHELAQLPCDMGRKMYRFCRTKGCDFSETVAATAAERAETAPLADSVRNFQAQVLDEAIQEMGRRKKPR
jgi:hypothetical protein